MTKRRAQPSPRTLLGSYIQYFCGHSIDQNSITWPHLAAKAGWGKIFTLNRYAPNYEKGGSLSQDWVYQLEQYCPLGQDTSLLKETVSIFQDIYTPRPKTHLMPAVYNASHCIDPMLPHTEEVALALNFRLLWQAFCLPRAVVPNFPGKYSP